MVGVSRSIFELANPLLLEGGHTVALKDLKANVRRSAALPE